MDQVNSGFAGAHARFVSVGPFYDGAWTNLTTTSILTGYSSCSQTTPYAFSLSVNASNQITTSGFSYDAAGNLQSDGINSYVWNAESEVKSVNNGNETYTYDGDGNRIQKSNGTIYWYGAGTEILDEYASGAFTNEYVFFGGKRVAMRSSGTVYYYEDDMLGSARTMVQAGQTTPCFDADFLPFGQEVDFTSTCGSNYKFEGKERDLETGNDDFGARYYRSGLGRWLSADWSSVPAPVPYANLTNPQTLNLYAMVSDNPETFADLDGHLTEGQGPYNVETADTSGGSEQGHRCDYVGGDCSKNATQGAAKTQAAQTQSKDKWVNPTGGAVRGCDGGGCGNYGAPRNEGMSPTHLGTDYKATPGQNVVAVHEGTVTTVGYAYKGDTRLRSVDIKTFDGYTIRELYVAPSSGVKAGTKVSAGQIIGTAQDIRVRTGPKITPHIHVTILHGGHHVNPETLIPVP